MMSEKSNSQILASVNQHLGIDGSQTNNKINVFKVKIRFYNNSITEINFKAILFTIVALSHHEEDCKINRDLVSGWNPLFD